MTVQEVIDTLQEMVKKDPSVAKKPIITDIPFNLVGLCDMYVLESISDDTEAWGIEFNFGKEYIDEEEE
jgi:hypothetical protein|nr:MAG TPA: hypothetical protein [Caudoviricetes sp.]